MKRLLLAAGILLLFPSIYLNAQEEGETSGPQPTFMDTTLETHELTIDPAWRWTPIAGRRLAYVIDIDAPTSWASAHLCIDGKSIKEIAAGTRRFKWSFSKLEPGSHMISLLIIDDMGNAGVVHRVLK